MLSAAKLKYLKSLQHKKFRQKYGEFLIEGDKVVMEAMESAWEVSLVVYTAGHLMESMLPAAQLPAEIATEQQMQQLSAMHTPPGIIAVVKMPAMSAFMASGWSLVLDGIRDPGNMGTLIRTAAWMGFRQIICSEDTVDLYNPKTIQSTMGAMFHIPVWYCDLAAFLPQAGLPVYAADMAGKPIDKTTIPSEGLLVIGGESAGVRSAVLQSATDVVQIPASGAGESLNAAVAGGILMWEISRRMRV